MLKASLWNRLKLWVQQEQSVLITSAGVTMAIIIFRLIGILQLSELTTLDQLFRLRPPEPVDARIVIVTIDEKDIQQVEQWPIPGNMMAQLLEKLNSYQPRVIGLDIYRDLPVEPGEAEFVKACESIPNLIGIEKLQDKASSAIAPPEALRQRDRVGFNNVITDTDGKVRRSLLYWHVDGRRHTSFALQLALVYLKTQGITPKQATINPDYLQLGQGVFYPLQPHDGGYVGADAKGYQILTNFRNPPKFRTVSFSDVLADRVNPNWLRSRIVVIGSTAPSLQDFVYTPFSSQLIGEAKPIAGVELHASFVSQILSSALDGRPVINVWSELWEWLWIFGWSSLGASVVWRWRHSAVRKQHRRLPQAILPRRLSVSLLLLSASLSGICSLAFLAGWWLPFVPGLLGLLSSAAVITSHLAYIQEELKRSKEFLQTVINTIPDPVFVKDKNHRWIILNQAYCQFIGYPLEKLMEKSDYDIFPQHEAEAFWTQDELVFQTSQPQEHESEFTDAFGITYLIATKRSLHKDAAGNLFLVGIIRDITERKRTEERLRRTAAELTRSNLELKLSADRLRYLAYHDPLTGLANRKQFYERLNHSLDWARRNNQLLAVMYLDLDGFKQVNDTLGHDMGDQLLRVVAQRLTNSLRSSDIVSRLGGDEFTVILPGIPQSDYVAKVAEKISHALSQAVLLEGKNVFVTVSIGISLYPIDGEIEETLIKKADTAMYCAKQQGRNQYKYANSI
jgi:diguanylate cyclase (GGDEF)-like protein/PAS domain S-box-containing protein